MFLTNDGDLEKGQVCEYLQNNSDRKRKVPVGTRVAQTYRDAFAIFNSGSLR